MSTSRQIVASVVLTSATLLAGCERHPGESRPAVPDLDERASALARSTILVDTHIDLPYALQGELRDVAERLPDGQFDWVRARAGGLDAAFMSIYVPASRQGTGTETAYADGLIDLVEQIAHAWPDRFLLARSPADVREAHARGLVALPLGIENGAAIGNDLRNLEHFAHRGVRYITLTHAEDNSICDSSFATTRTWHGLSPFGREAVAEMNRLGIMVDVSHVSDEAFWQVAEIARAPLIASHSGCRSFTPGWERNMDDAMIRKLAELGGVIQVNFGSAFLTEQAQRQSQEGWDTVAAYLKDHDLPEEGPEAEAAYARYWQEHPRVETHVTDVADQIDHVVQLVGIDHVGLGSDFDGVDSLPVGLEDVAAYPKLIAELLRRGYSEQDIAKVCGGNLLRVWEQVERAAVP